MSVIENFNELTEQERLQFAEQLLAKINAENTFLTGNTLTVFEVSADEITGDLTIEVDHEDGLVVERPAGWTVFSEDDTHNPEEEDVEFLNDSMTDVKKAFNTLSAAIDGYKVTVDVYDLLDWDRDDVDVDSVDEQDDGFSYEYWGSSGYKDESSWECEGTIYYTYSVAIALNVEPADTMPEEPATETEEN